MSSAVQSRLGISDATSASVMTIMDAYKDSLNIVINDKRLTANEQRNKIDALIEQKNRNLKKILTDIQLRKYVPVTELGKLKE
jgi:hypothetical protein